MTRILSPIPRLLFACCLALAGAARAEGLTIAVAANFLSTLELLDQSLQAAGHAPLIIVPGASGSLYAQITHGAPFDVFLSADRARPQALVAAGLGHDATPYATGVLALVQRDAARAMTGQRVALADPAVAPYGAAAMSALDGLGIRPNSIQIITAENVAQTASLFATGNADFVFVAKSQLPVLTALGLTFSVSYPPHSVDLEQDGVILTATDQPDEAAAFMAYLTSAPAQEIIAAAGYEVAQ